MAVCEIEIDKKHRKKTGNKFDAYGTEDERIISFIDAIQERTWISTCSEENCPKKRKMRRNRNITLK